MTNWSDMTVSTVLRIGGVITRSISFKTEVVDLPALCRLTMLHLRLLEILELKGTSKPRQAASTRRTRALVSRGGGRRPTRANRVGRKPLSSFCPENP